ncbi:MAG: hypothetical protein ACOYOQ_06040 [Microthrixaceae bacterium]
MMKRAFAPVALIGALLLGASMIPSAGAAGTVTVAPNPVAFAPGQTAATTTVTWSGQTPNQLIYVDICRKLTSDPTFQPGLDCAPLSSINPTATATGSGSTQFEVFRGPDPSGDLDWGCFAANDQAPAGIQKNTTCYVRVTSNSLFNNTSAVDAPFTIVESGGVIPEAPVTILLPVVGALVLLGGFMLLRRRQAVA